MTDRPRGRYRAVIDTAGRRNGTEHPPQGAGRTALITTGIRVGRGGPRAAQGTVAWGATGVARQAKGASGQAMAALVHGTERNARATILGQALPRWR